MKSKTLLSFVIGTGLALVVAVSIPTGAQAEGKGPRRMEAEGERGSSTEMMRRNRGEFRPAMKNPGQYASSSAFMNGVKPKPAVIGKVTSITGNTIVIQSQKGNATSTNQLSFTVDATNALVKKGNATSTLADIKIGDSVFVEGTINGTQVTARVIFNGAPNMMPGARVGNKGDLNGDGPRGEKGNKDGGNSRGQNEFAQDKHKGESKGLFGGIKNFFGKMFGF